MVLNFIFQTVPNPWPFNQDIFLASLEYAGPQLTCNLKGNWKGLYKKFFRSPNFTGWFNVRYKEMMIKLQVLQIETLCSFVSFIKYSINKHTKS